MEIGMFKYKCTCFWSKDDEFGFIPSVDCEVHGKKVKELLKDTVPYEAERDERNDKEVKKK